MVLGKSDARRFGETKLLEIKVESFRPTLVR
jgi:hypothetical protein